VSTQPLQPAGLRCAHAVNPLGVAADRVGLSWTLTGAGDNRAQSAYQVLAAAGEAELGRDIGSAWDSGRVESSSTAGVAWGGRPLGAGKRYVWKVRVWDETGQPSPWSEPASFEIALDPGDWQASWIGRGTERRTFRVPSGPGPADQVAKSLTPVGYLRRSFPVGAPVASARLFITARGLYEARLNGERIGDAVLTPGWTDYARRIQYQTYDVTGLLRDGENVLGALLGDGWYCGFLGFDAKRAGARYGRAPELLAQLAITFADGTQARIVTGTGWRSSTGAILHADLLMGEAQDSGQEPRGWDRPGFDASGWLGVTCRDRDATPLVADPGPPVRVTEDLAPRCISRGPGGTFIVDFGQNLAGWLRLTVDGPAGRHVRIRHSEVLAEDGRLYTDNLRTARQADEFISSGSAEIFEPHFTLHGFRYAEISGYPGELGAEQVVARVVHSDTPVSGSFESSEGWLNQLMRSIDWGQRGNFISIPTDCPQRDERLGWLGDAQIFARTACYNRDTASFFGKWLDDVADAQLPSGAFTDIAPSLRADWSGAAGWGDAGVIIPWTVYTMYGDRGILERHYGAMTAWMEFIARDNPDFLRTRNLGNNYGDWLAPGDDRTSRELLATAYWAYDAALMAEIAGVIGRPGDAAAYRALGAKIGSAFAAAYVADDGQLASGTQTSYALGLHMNLIPDALRAAAAAHLVDAIRQAGWRLTTGFVGVGYLLPVLSSHGYSSVAYRVLEQDALPSWRYMLDGGATTMWERWDGWTREHGFQSPSMNSFNHYAFGAVGEWIYRFVLGIDCAPGRAGFERLILRPHPGGSLRSARGSYRCVRGLISSAWERRDGAFTLRVELPPNVTASVRVPSADPAGVRDAHGGQPAGIADFPGAPGAREAVFEVGSGMHEFSGAAAQEGAAEDPPS
jgi:alpha-L-rhamnosidase